MIVESLAVAVGGACGALFRGWLMQRFHPARLAAHALSAKFGPEFATWAANLLGCLLLALWLRFGASSTPANALAGTFVVTGFCGGLTTFSTLCADAFRLHGDASTGAAARYLAASVVTGAALFNLVHYFWR